MFFQLSLCGVLSGVLTLEMIAERLNVTFVNLEYLEWLNFTVVRYGRRSPYYINLEAATKHVWGNNVTINLVFYEFLSNEYRRSFVEFHFPLCKLIDQEDYIDGLLARGLAGKKCPYPPDEYHLRNLTAPTSKSNVVWPFSRARIDFYLQAKPNNDTIARGYVFVTIK